MGDASYSHCPNCQAEYRPGFDTCTDCGIALVAGPAPAAEEHAAEHTQGRGHPMGDRNDVPVVLGILPRLQAQILVGKLQSEGLVASADEPTLLAYGAILPEGRDIRVWVLESQLDQAREIARRALSGDDAI
jgi:hypothetical protein